MTPRYVTFKNIFTAHAQKQQFRSFQSKIWRDVNKDSRTRTTDRKQELST